MINFFKRYSQSKGQFFKRVIMVWGGVMFNGFGIAFNVSANLGADPASVLFDGVSRASGLNLGMVVNIFTVGLFVLMLLFEKKYVNVGTFLNIIFLGVFVDLASLIFNRLNLSQNLYSRLFACILGMLMLYLGIALSVSADVGIDTWTGAVMLVKGKARIDFKFAKILTDVMALVIGYLLGGILGPATLVSSCIAGPIIQRLSNWLSK